MSNSAKDNETASAPNNTEDVEPVTGEDGGSASTEPAERDRAGERTLFARQIQRASALALKRVRQNHLLASSEWAEPLTAAPTAISVMAFLMKTATNKKVAGLEVPSRDIKNVEGTEVVGTLKSPYFHTGLLDCSDVGRLAFLDAQKGMNKINSTANSIMADGGPITYMLELLEDSEDAKLNLKPTLDKLKTKAAVCGAEAASIQKKFEYWHLVINHLAIQAKDIYTNVVGEQKQIGDIESEVQNETKKLDDERLLAIEREESLKTQLKLVSEKVTRAENEVRAITSVPPPYEPSYFQDLRAAEKRIPSTPAPERERGILEKGITYVTGTLKISTRADQAHEDNHRAKELEAQHKLIATEQARRDKKKREAEERLQKVKGEETKLYTEYDAVSKKVSDSRDRLAEAKHSLAKASSDLERLGSRKLELNEIIEILQRSTKQLAMLKGQLGKLIIFFSTLETWVAEHAVEDLHKFLTLIENNSQIEGEKVINLQLRKASQKSVITTALQIQGQFSAISDISSVYVKISNNYIRPAIDRMEELGMTSDDEFPDASRDFSRWCKKTITDIDGVFEETHAKMDANMAKRVGMLSTLAIEAADENSSDE